MRLLDVVAADQAEPSRPRGNTSRRFHQSRKHLAQAQQVLDRPDGWLQRPSITGRVGSSKSVQQQRAAQGVAGQIRHLFQLVGEVNRLLG